MVNNILIISGYFYPEVTPRSFRTTELVKEFSRRGYNVTVLLPRVHFLHRDFAEKYKVKFIYINLSLGADLPKGNSLLIRGFRFLLQKIYTLLEYPNIKYLNSISKSISNILFVDLVISIAAPHAIHWGVNKALSHGKIVTKKWIADCGDPFMGNETIWKPFYFKYFENRFLKKADFVTIPVKDAIKAYNPKYKSKIRVIPQGFDMSRKYLKTTTHVCPTFCYSGVFYRGYRDPIKFIDYLAKLNINFKFIIYTPMSNFIIDRISKLNSKVELRNILPRDLLLEEISQMDFLINFSNKGSVQVPSKLIDYSIAGRPILSVSYNSINEKLIDEFLVGNYTNQTVLPNLEQYDIINVATQFLSL